MRCSPSSTLGLREPLPKIQSPLPFRPRIPHVTTDCVCQFANYAQTIFQTEGNASAEIEAVAKFKRFKCDARLPAAFDAPKGLPPAFGVKLLEPLSE